MVVSSMGYNIASIVAAQIVTEDDGMYVTVSITTLA